jgi:mersacidin/lichenicidin family type 2 lantibiotic
MSNLNIIRAWKDEEYRKSLTDAERPLFQTYPARLIEGTEDEMNHVYGGDSFDYCSQGGDTICYLN